MQDPLVYVNCILVTCLYYYVDGYNINVNLQCSNCEYLNKPVNNYDSFGKAM